MSIHGSARVGTVPGARTPEDHAPVAPAPRGALYAPTGEHIGLSPVAKAMHQPVSSGHPAPPAQRLFALCVAAAALGFGGIVIGTRGWFGLVMHKAESWYLPAIVIIGVLGVLSAAGGFLTVHRRHAPWVMISLSAAILITAIAVTASGIN